VTGPVAAVGAEGTTFEVDAGGAVVVVKRAPRARMTIAVRKAGAAVTVTGKCQGLEEAGGPGVRVVLEDAIVLRPPGGVPGEGGGGFPGAKGGFPGGKGGFGPKK
jgi:uncharacterized protein GlcG (DUF336 family)